MENFDSQNKKLVLVVDDEEINRELLGNILNKKYKVEYACDGEEAMQCIRRDRSMLSCILLDLNMPKKSGLEVLSEIRSDDALSHIPVMMPVCRLGDDHFAVMGDATEFPKMIPSFLEKIKTTGRGKVIDFQVGVFIEQGDPVDRSCNHRRNL